ncbi:glycosyltransferase family 8 protein [Methanobrevibacter millerae]|uniref:Glycosyl transferase GT8 family n=1 Tax=Methanobrevibacter millerae TaxID=230361 RepID=A0A0U2SKB7_9EURY|nr:glycosyltransferase family 8 protein [Methanobrevibacter millerae]ALT69301.1 glycosyl transferase GT8 family [Methanobrevibacter millerae]
MFNVVLASNNEYSSFLCITLISLLENNKNDFNDINVFILSDGITNKNINKIKDVVNEYECSLHFIKTKNIEDLNFHIASLDRDNIISFTTYSRLFISSLLPKDIDKILYLDCDSLIVDSLKQLWDEDISDYYCAGVLDCCNTTIQEMLGYSKEDKYVNAGVLLINLKKWRENNVEEKFIEFIKDNQNRFYQHDQGVINVIFKDKIKIISPKYNLQRYFQYMPYFVSRKFCCIEHEYYSKEIMDDARKNPIFLHFCAADVFRPWKNPDHPYAELYQYYAKLSNSESAIVYSTKFNNKLKLFQLLSKNKFGNFILYLTPYFLVKKVVNKSAVKELELEFEKAKQHEL